MSKSIPTAPFGTTGHRSTRVLFGAAAFAAMKQERCDQVMELLLEYGVNHLDTAASYGSSELRLRPWLQQHRARFFLATKTGNRSYQGARDSLHRSLERLGVDHVDLIQLHHLVDESHWAKALGPRGALEAMLTAQEEGLVRFIGVTGHGTKVAKRHYESLQRHAFDSVLLPYTPAMMAQPQYAADFARLEQLCQERGVAMQTIKAVAKRRWRTAEQRRFSWYEPVGDESAIRTLVHWVLQRPGTFLNTSSDARLLGPILEAAATPLEPVSASTVDELIAEHDLEALFVPERYEEVGLA